MRSKQKSGGRFKNEKRRREYLVGRYAANKRPGSFWKRKIFELSRLLPAPFPIPLSGITPLGIPELTLTHTEDWALAIAYESGHIMGVDLEKISPSREMSFLRKMTSFEKKISDKIFTSRKNVNG